MKLYKVFIIINEGLRNIFKVSNVADLSILIEDLDIETDLIIDDLFDEVIPLFDWFEVYLLGTH